MPLSATSAKRVTRLPVALDHVERVVRPRGEQARDLAARGVRGDQQRQGRVRERVAVGAEEDVAPLDVLPGPRESLADARFQPGVDEFDLPARVGKLVASEVVRDHPAAVAEAEHELGVPEVGVVAHDVPEQRAPADRRHRLGEPLGERADLEAHPLAAAEDHNLHNY